MRGLLPLLLLLRLFFAHSAYSFQAHRVVQYDKSKEQLGSRRAAINHIATTIDPSSPISKTLETSSRKSKDLARKLVVVDISDLTSERLVEIQKRRGASSVLILLDKDFSSASAEDLDKWRALERTLITSKFEIPIYFAFKDQELESMIAELSEALTRDESMVNQYQVVSNGPESKPLAQQKITNFQGWHHSAPSMSTDSDSLPTIAVVSYYDTFGASESLSFGVRDSGTGAVTLLETARVFARLYREFRTHGPYNILFVLTGAGRLNFAGIRHWLNTVDTRVLESLEFALCLEDLAGDDLYLHISRPAKTDALKRLYSAFTETAEEMDISLELVHRKINMSEPEIPWQHQAFSKKRILAATLSSKKEPSVPLHAASIFDTKERVKSEVLQRNVKFLVESLAKQIYSSHGKEIRVASKSQAVSPHFVDAWLNFFGTQPRMVPNVPGSPVLKELEKAFGKYTSDSKATLMTIERDEYVFYQHDSLRNISIYEVKPIMFDAILAVCIMAYLLVLHLVLQGKKTISDFKGFIGKKD